MALTFLPKEPIRFIALWKSAVRNIGNIKKSGSGGSSRCTNVLCPMQIQSRKVRHYPSPIPSKVIYQSEKSYLVIKLHLSGRHRTLSATA